MFADPGSSRFIGFHEFLTAENMQSAQASDVEVHAYDDALGAVQRLAEQGKRVWIDPDRVNYAFANVVPRDRCVRCTVWPQIQY